MSGIYEALRQKREELSLGRSESSAGAPVATQDPAAEGELGGLGEVLQAMVVADLEENGPITAPDFPLVTQVVSPISEPAPTHEYPRLSLADPRDPALLFQNDADGLAAEQFRFLRRTLEQKFPTGGTLLITSPAPKDGKSLTTLNLCTCLAEAGRPTLLVEADTRQPSLARFFRDTDGRTGIEQALAGSVNPQKAIHFVDELSMSVALVAEPPNDPSRLLGSAGSRRFLSWARENFTWVVIDAPPVLPAIDVTLLAGLADATLLVIRSHRTPRGLTTRAIEMLGNHLSGVIVNDAAIESNSYGYLYGRKKASGSRNAS